MNSNPTILFAEDKKMLLANEIDYLELDKKATIQFSEELVQTKSHLKNRKYDLIIVNQYLPGSHMEKNDDSCFSGLGNLLSHYNTKNKNHDTPVLLITVRNVRNLCASLKKNGAVEKSSHIRLVSKPFKDGEFEKAVDDALDPGSPRRVFN